jgi:hypothetical protein
MHNNLTPSAPSLARTYDTTISTATDITLQTNTHFLRVCAIGEGVFLRYAATASSVNFDEYIPADTVQDFQVPVGVTVISVIERAASAAVVVIEK